MLPAILNFLRYKLVIIPTYISNRMTIDQLLKQYQKPHAEDLFSPTVIDLFCGCGGLSLGFKQAGYQVLAGIDHERPALMFSPTIGK